LQSAENRRFSFFVDNLLHRQVAQIAKHRRENPLHLGRALFLAMTLDASGKIQVAEPTDGKHGRCGALAGNQRGHTGKCGK
jgi:hypothetical protein